MQNTVNHFIVDGSIPPNNKIKKEKEKIKTTKKAVRMYIFENSPLVSEFQSYNSPIPYRVVNLLKFLTTDKYRTEVERCRDSSSANEKKRIKAELPCITVSGTFERRTETEIIEHSHYICLDIDGKEQTEQQIDWDAKKRLVGEMFDCIYFIGLSIGGNGIFIVAKIRNPKYHKMHYRALAKEILLATDLKIDMACSDVARLRGVSYDPSPYYNANATQYNKVLLIDKHKNNASKIKTRRDKQNVEDAIKLICTHKINIAVAYQDWLKIALAIYDGFHEEGRGYFHLISSIYEYYEKEECDHMYNKCQTWGTYVRLETFFYFCKLHGIIYRKGGMTYDPTIIKEE